MRSNTTLTCTAIPEKHCGTRGELAGVGAPFALTGFIIAECRASTPALCRTRGWRSRFTVAVAAGRTVAPRSTRQNVFESSSVRGHADPWVQVVPGIFCDSACVSSPT